MCPARIIALSISLVMAAIAGCTPSPVDVELNFPTDDAFLHSSQARLRIFALDTHIDSNMDGVPDQLGICPELLDRLQTARFPFDPLYDTDLHDVCDFRAQIPLPHLDSGPHAFLVDVRGRDNGLILRGCRIGEVYGGAPDLVIELHPTEAYTLLLDMPVTGTPESRCGGGGM